MADVETKETKVASPEKKSVEQKKDKEVEEVDEDSRASENGDAKEAKENGEEKPATDEKEPESTENGDSTDAPADACTIKRKSTAGVEASADAPDGVSPEKKAKIEDKPVETATESNGDIETAA